MKEWTVRYYYGSSADAGKYGGKTQVQAKSRHAAEVAALKNVRQQRPDIKWDARNFYAVPAD